jgi:hypothetical protein
MSDIERSPLGALTGGGNGEIKAKHGIFSLSHVSSVDLGTNVNHA